MKKSLYILILTAFAATSFASKVTKVELAYQNGEAIARIDVSGQIRFTHQTEIPKDGKPDRVIIDILSATHELGGKVFDNLPVCPVTALRTSQYSVKPEAVVRLVFDMKKTPVYQVETQGQSIVVHFVDRTAAPFPTWTTSQDPKAPVSSSPAVAAAPKSETARAVATTVTPAQKNAQAESDRQASLAGTTPKPVSSTPPTKPADKGFIAASKPASIPPSPTPTSAVASAPKIETPVSKPATPVVSDVPVSKPATPVVSGVPVSKPVAPTVAASPKTDTKPVESKPVATSVSPTVSPVPKPDVKPVETKPSTPIATTSSPVAKSAGSVKSDVEWTPPVAASKPATQAPVASSPTVSTPKPEAKPAETKGTTSAVTPTVTPAPVVSAKPAANDAKPAVSPSPVSPTVPTTTVPSPTAKAPAATPPLVTPSAGAVAPKPEAPKPSVPSTTTVPSANLSTSPVVKPAVPSVSSPVVAKPAEKPTPGSPLPSEIAQKEKDALAKPIVKAPKPYTMDDEYAPAPEDLEPAEENPYVDHDSPAGAQWAEEDAAVDTNSTARFRRHPLSAAKIKGTLIAQFPQRLVIKYETNGVRDPFATLIDDSKTFNSPTSQGVPNVDGLKLVGVIVARQAGNRALFQDKNGYSYMLQSGDKVRNGYVLRIESDRAYFQIFEYGWSRTIALKIDES